MTKERKMKGEGEAQRRARRGLKGRRKTERKIERLRKVNVLQIMLKGSTGDS